MRDDSTLRLYLPAEYLATNPSSGSTTCFSAEFDTLARSTCFFQADLLNNRLVVSIQLREIASQKKFSISLDLTNPAVPKSDYSFSSDFSALGVLYAKSSAGTEPHQLVNIKGAIAVDDASINNLAQLTLTNIPKNAG